LANRFAGKQTSAEFCFNIIINTLKLL